MSRITHLNAKFAFCPDCGSTIDRLKMAKREVITMLGEFDGTREDWDLATEESDPDSYECAYSCPVCESEITTDEYIAHQMFKPIVGKRVKVQWYPDLEVYFGIVEETEEGLKVVCPELDKKKLVRFIEGAFSYEVIDPTCPECFESITSLDVYKHEECYCEGSFIGGDMDDIDWDTFNPEEVDGGFLCPHCGKELTKKIEEARKLLGYEDDEKQGAK